MEQCHRDVLDLPAKPADLPMLIAAQRGRKSGFEEIVGFMQNHKHLTAPTEQHHEVSNGLPVV